MKRAFAGWALVLALPVQLHAAEVFVSEVPNGTPRYSTQALDASYELILGKPQQPAAPSTIRRTSAVARKAQDRLRATIERVAARHGFSPALVEAMIAVESNRNPFAVSSKGAQGVMQLMPATAARYGLNGPQAWRDPERNIDAGVRHLKDLLLQYHGNVVLALAAYNAGSGAVTRHRNRIPPYRETMLYVSAVLARYAASAH